MIEVGNIVTLENGQEYLILEKLEKNQKNYVYAVRVLEDETPTDEYIIYEVIINYEGTEKIEYLNNVDDKALYDELIEDFKDIVADKIYNGGLDEIELEEDEDVAA